MSYVKRSSNMAPSELGYPKVPDKCETNTKHTIAAMKISSSDNPLDTFKSAAQPLQSSSLPLKFQQQQLHQQLQHHQMRDAPKLASSTHSDTKNIQNLDDDELKNLLDEAISYKRPKDRENKSDIFKELLQDAELEDQARDTYPYYLSAHSDRCGAGSHHSHHPHTPGGSLQDLVESVNNEQLLLDSDYFVSGQTRRFHRHNSRYKKYSSSVSSRQREGGSLPSNVNVSSIHHHHLHSHSFGYVDSFLPHRCPNSSKSNSAKSSNNTNAGAGGNSKSYKIDSHENEGNWTSMCTLGTNILSNYHLQSPAIVAHTVNCAREASALKINGTATALASATALKTATANETSHNTTINIDESDETRHLLAHDFLAQGFSESYSSDDGTELVSIKKPRVTTMNYNVPNSNVNMDGTISEPLRHQSSHSVEKTIQFLKCSSQLTDAAAHINSKTIAKSSSIEPNKYLSTSTAKYVHLNSTQSQKQFDENCNGILPRPATGYSLTANQPKTKPKRSNKAERNTKTWTVPEPKGCSSSKYNIDSLVAFIENKEICKKSNIINVNKNVINSDRSRKDKKNTSKKDVTNKLKKSTSMEELKSSSKMEEEEIAKSERAQVSLRQKQMQQLQKRNNAADGKDTNPKQQSNQLQSTYNQQHKRDEHRSWGTEELNYLGERDANSMALADDEREPAKKLKDNNNGKTYVKSECRKTELTMSANVSMESIPTTLETVEFHVVTKKKKTKKRQIFEEAKAKQEMNQQARDHYSVQHTGRNINNNLNHNGAAGKYQPSTSYTNDREVYLRSPITKNHRRKSTSSMPPSDKSDSSDLDSIHSLPAKSTTTCAPLISYADIARIANQPDKYTTNAWPTISHNVSGNNSAEKSFENLNVSNCGSSNGSAKNQISGRTISIDANTDKVAIPADLLANEKSISYIRRLLDDKSSFIVDDSIKQTIQLTGTVNIDTKCVVERVKSPNPFYKNGQNQLQKSKSMDCAKFDGGMSMDQFPGLEKTVKPQKTHANNISVAITSTSFTVDKATAKPTLPKKCSPTDDGNTGGKDVVTKRQASHVADEKIVDAKVSIATHQLRLVFIQNNAKAEEIANSDSCNLFAPISASSMRMKKVKKPYRNAAASSSLTYPRNESVAHRPAVIIFNDRERKRENVSPLLFGDFNDDILKLIKSDDNHSAHTHHQHCRDFDEAITAKQAPMALNPCSNNNNNNKNNNNNNIIINSNGTFKSADHYNAVSDGGNLLKLSDVVTSPQSDPGYSSAHNIHGTSSTESLEVTFITGINKANNVKNHHQIPHQRRTMQCTQSTATDISLTHAMHTEITNKTNVVTKNTNNNKNVNKTSDVASNQSINNNNDNNIGNMTLHKAVQLNGASYNYKNNNLNNTKVHRSNNKNNTVNQQLSTKRTNRSVIDSGAKTPKQQLQTIKTNNKLLKAIISVSSGRRNNSIHKTNSKSNSSSINKYQQQLSHKRIIGYSTVVSNNLENANNQLTHTTTNNNRIVNHRNSNNHASKASAVVNSDLNRFLSPSSSSMATVPSSRMMPRTYGKYVKAKLPTSVSSSVSVNYNHEKVVNFVGLAWKDILNATTCGGAHYYNGQ